MANIKDLKKKIKSTKGTLKITTALKLVSAAKMASAQSAISNARPYAEELEDTIRTISALVQNYSHDYLAPKENKSAILIVLSANKGLCGGYNSQLSKAVKKYVDESDLDFKVYFAGKKVMELLADKVNFGKSFDYEKAQASLDEIKKIAEEAGNNFASGEVGHVYVAYNVFHSAMSFTPTVKPLLPMALDADSLAELKDKHPFDFKYDPSPAKILDTLIPETYVSTLYTCYLDAVAAEHGSRMVAMDSATSNCQDLIRTTTLKMNKLRQAAITTELIEVISGAESLNA